MKNVICKDCGEKNYSGSVYCTKCSGNVYKQELEDKINEYIIYYL